MKINFDGAKIEQFCSQDNSSKKGDKVVLRLKNNTELECVHLKDVGFFEKLKAKFGFGSLNLRKIAEVIDADPHAVGTALTDVGVKDKKLFFTKIKEKSDKYNSLVFRSLYNKIDDQVQNRLHDYGIMDIQLVCKSDIKATCTDAVHKEDMTYNGTPEVNCDITHSNQEKGFGFVMDGSGHNNAAMHTVLHRHIKSFIEKYDPIEISKSGSILNAKKAIESELKILGEKIWLDETPNVMKGQSIFEIGVSALPAFSFAQIIQVQGKSYLISSQSADTAIFIKNGDTFVHPELSDRKGKTTGFGDGTTNEYYVGEMNIIPLEENSEIIIFSDGIGEFLTKEELQEIIKKNGPDDRIGKCKEAIIANGKTFTKGFINKKLTEEALQKELAKSSKDPLLNQFQGKNFDEVKEIISKSNDEELSNVLLNVLAEEDIYIQNEDSLKSANGLSLKYHSSNEKDRASHDDISMVSLTV